MSVEIRLGLSLAKIQAASDDTGTFGNYGRGVV